MTVELRVYDPSAPATLVGTLGQAYGIEWIDEVDETGGGRFTIPHDAPELVTTPSLLDRRKIVRVNRDGTDVFAWLIGPRSRERGESYDPITVIGKGVLAILEDHAVQPAGKLDQPGNGWANGENVADNRIFGFQSYEFNGSTWDAPTSFGRQDNPDLVLYRNRPSEWPDGRAEWLGPQPLDVNGLNPAGVWYARREWTWSSGYTARLHFSCDYHATVWFDGEVVIQTETAYRNWRRTYTVDLDIAAGAHCIAIRIVNEVGASSFLLNISKTDDNGDLGATLIRSFGHSDPGTKWQVLAFPANPPGMTVGHILRLLLADAQTDGSLTGVTLGFDDTLDTAGVAWPQIEVAFLVGNDTLLTALQRLQDFGYDFRMTPGLVLQGWVSRGVDRSATVTLGTGHTTSLSQNNDGEYANTVLARTNDAWVIYPDPPPATGRVDVFVSLGALPTVEAAESITAEIVAAFDAEARTVSATFTDAAGPQPYIAFQPGDIISAPALPSIVGAWTGTAQRVLSVTGQVEDGGGIEWTVELQEAQ